MRYISLVRRLFHKFGFDISRFEENQLGRNPFADMERFVADSDSTTIFDVGANVGQSVERFRLHFPLSQIHSFEPSPGAYRELQALAASRSGVTAWNVALGAAPGKAMLNENEYSVMNSMLELGEQGWGCVEKQTEVSLQSIDAFCREQNVDRIDILKSDTQGCDLDVFRGAEQMMRKHRIGLIMCEVNFAELYRGAAPFDAIFRFLLDRDFALVAFYAIHFSRNTAGWTDALFVNKVVHQQAIS